MWNEVEDKKGIIWSCGGGVPQNVPTENMQAFIETIQKLENQQ
jgi:uroporphyrinogen-III decarboxylase